MSRLIYVGNGGDPKERFSCNVAINIGINHDFPFINIRKVPREVLKTEGVARGFQPSRGTLQLLMNDKIMFDRYYCINSAKHWRTLFYILITLFYASTLLKTMHDSGPVQILIILHVLCLGVIKNRARAHENSLINTWLLCPLKHDNE